MQNSGYSRKQNNSLYSLYPDEFRRTVVDGNTVRKVEPEVRERTASPARRPQQKKRPVRLDKLKIVRCASIVVGIAIILTLAFVNLDESARANTLAKQVAGLERDLAELTEQNNSREYDIKKSIDLNQIIKVATEDLGMVRGSSEQVVMFDASDGEYIQQVASIPKK